MLLDDIIRIKSKADSARREPDLPHALLWDSMSKSKNAPRRPATKLPQIQKRMRKLAAGKGAKRGKR